MVGPEARSESDGHQADPAADVEDVHRRGVEAPAPAQTGNGLRFRVKEEAVLSTGETDRSFHLALVGRGIPVKVQCGLARAIVVPTPNRARCCPMRLEDA